MVRLSPSPDAPFICRLEFFILSIIFLSYRIAIGTIFNNIADCDEVFNYWEPVHFISFLPLGTTTRTKLYDTRPRSAIPKDPNEQSSDSSGLGPFPTLGSNEHSIDDAQHDSSKSKRRSLQSINLDYDETEDVSNEHNTINHHQMSTNSKRFHRVTPNHRRLATGSLLTGSLQTWEYSPTYALRSYLYVVIHCLLVWVSQLVNRFLDATGLSSYASLSWYAYLPESVKLFFLTRSFLSLLAGLSELHFSRSIKRMFGNRIATLYLLVNLLSPGTLIASNQLLPSTSFMWISLWSLSYLLKHQFHRSLQFAVLGTLTCWPFAVVVYLPLVLVAVVQYSLWGTIWSILQSVIVVMVCVVSVDYIYYGKLLATPLNLVIYNTGFGRGGKSSLYGIEPIGFYARNLLLNFHVFVLLSAVGLVIMSVKMVRRNPRHGYRDTTSEGENVNRSNRYSSLPLLANAGLRSSLFAIGVPIPLWLGLMALLPHKEERFLTPIYPLICLSSAVAVGWLFCSTQETTRTDTASSLLFTGDPESGIRKKHDDWRGAAEEKTEHLQKSSSDRAFSGRDAFGTKQRPSTKSYVKQDSSSRFSFLSFPFYRRPPQQTPNNCYTPLPLIPVYQKKVAVRKFTTIKSSSRFVGLIFWTVCFSMSASRLLALYYYYWKPIASVWMTSATVLYSRPLATGPDSTTFVPMTLCTGREWYRYPSSFFLPPGSELGFVRSGFTGLLPGKFKDTRQIPDHMNDDNQEELSHYTPLADCDYLIDSSSESTDYMPRSTLLQLNNASLTYSSNVKHSTVEIVATSAPDESAPHDSIKRRIQVVACSQLLDKHRSRFPFRSFFISEVFVKATTHIQFCLWKLSLQD